MKFQKGQSGNPEGRPKGAKNRVGKDLRDRIISFLSNEFENIQKDFEVLESRDRVKLYFYLLQYGLPKLQAVTTETQLEQLTDDQLNELFERITKTANDEI